MGKSHPCGMAAPIKATVLNMSEAYRKWTERPPDGNLWVTYSMNKEDLWVSKIPVPIREKAIADTKDVFSDLPNGKELDGWNIFSPLWCQAKIEKPGREKVLALHDSDPFDYAKAEKVIPEAKNLVAEYSVTPQQNNFGDLEIEMADAKGTPCLRIVLDASGSIWTKQGYRNKNLKSYRAGEKLDFIIALDTATRMYTVAINGGKANNNLCFAPVHSVERVVFRTGSVRRFPNADTPTDRDYDLPNSNKKDKEAVYFIHYLKTETKP
jgi:hypothetical protein